MQAKRKEVVIKNLLTSAALALGLSCVFLPAWAMNEGESEVQSHAVVHANALTQDQLKHFSEEGYVGIKSLFPQEDVKEISSHLDNVLVGAKRRAAEYIAAERAVGRDVPKGFRYEYLGDKRSASAYVVPNDDGPLPTIKLISWVGGVNPALLAFGRDPRITTPVGQLLVSEKADHLINQLHPKLPGDGTEFDWHQDIQNRRLFDKNWEDTNKKGSFVQVLTAIDRTPLESGPLVIMRQSQTEDLFLDTIAKEDRLAWLQQKYDLSTAEPLLLEAGDTIFMHPLILHSSGENTSQESRRLFINGFSYPGANKKPYPGKGSSEEINLNISADLLESTNTFMKSLTEGAASAAAD